MAFDAAAFREQSRDTWSGVADGWENRRDWLMKATASVNDWLVAKADPKPGQTVLEIAAGTGDLGFEAARRVGPDGKLISTDFVAEMVDVARRAGAGEGITNAEHRIMDAERMDLDDDSVDAELCRWAFMLMADPGAAFAESRRVLRDGGRLTFAVWTGAERNPWIALPAIQLIERGHMTPPEPDGPGILAFADPDRFIPLLRKAGFGEPEIEELTFNFSYEDFDDVWDSMVKLAGPLSSATSHLTENERQATYDAIQESLLPFRSEDGSYRMPASTWGVVAS